jgi:putative CocE/NonD family hydrolase
VSKRQVLAALGTLGLVAYIGRRRLIARWLRLPPARHSVRVERGIRIPMPDGIALVADHYFPKAPGAFPTILIRTPYGRDLRGTTLGILHMFVSQRFAERGYHVIVQDTRGRFDSEGEWEPFVNEARDGRATLEWIARQPWFDGNLGMWGPSYEGYVQWAAAVDAPDYFKAMLPSVTGSQINPYSGTAFGLDGMLRWLDNLNQSGGMLTQIVNAVNRFIDPSAQTRALTPAFQHLPVGEADTLVVGHAVSYYRKWLENARADAPFWQALYQGARMERVNAAAHFVSGWHDILLFQLLTDYEAMRAAGHSPYLTVGPWRHLDVGAAEEALRAGVHWFDANLKGIRRRLRVNPVRLYMMGVDRWVEFASWPPPAIETRLYLHDRARLAAGLPVADSPADHYRYDPANPTPAVGGPVYHQDGGVKDNRALESRADVLTYTTPPLERDVDVIGWVKLELFVRSSLAHADFFGRLCDVQPDDRSLNVCDGLFRIEPGSGEPQPDGSTRIVIEMWATVQRFLRGHCIRLQVSSGAHPRWNRNLGTGEPMTTATRMMVAIQTVYHDAVHPSALILLVTQGEF